MSTFKSGFVNIFGYPNAGKSTLINAFIGEEISIVTRKAQTTRQRLLGLLTTKEFQIVFSDTPGILNPQYELQKTMVADIEEAFEDADIILYLTEIEDPVEKHIDYIQKINKLGIPFYLLINKIDLSQQEKLEQKIAEWEKHVGKEQIVPLSALHKFNVMNLLEKIKTKLPEHAAYYEDDILTDKSERYIASEMIRKQIFLKYEQEIPYSTEVVVSSFKEEEKIIFINADIYVSRRTQKPIIIGKGGKMLKEVGTEARKEMEHFFNKKVFLELYVRIRENWRNKPEDLKRFGYKK
jgi:GTP-binding protein Era